MTDTPNPIAALKGEILKDPAVILDDIEVMRALLKSDDDAKGGNVVDLRGAFVSRLEERLERLEDTHRTVIAAAFENLSGTNQVHRAVLALLEADSFEAFLQALSHDVANILGVDVIRLCLESEKADGGTSIGPDGPLKDIVVALPQNGVAAYITLGRSAAPRQVTLRTATDAKGSVFGDASVDVVTEAILRLDLGSQSLPGMIAFGSAEANRFSTDQATDLLVFLTKTVERILRRWVA